ncbi:MAG: GC-type dockerin domain-anchored protein [Phycisphaerales bacterium]
MRVLDLRNRVLAALAVSSACGSAFGQQYSITAINASNATLSTAAYSVNSFDAVASAVVSQSRAGLWSGGFLAVLPPLAGGSVSSAFGINDSSLVVGTSAGGFIGIPVKWPAGTGLPMELPNLGPRAGTAYDVNTIGAIAGEAYEPTPFGNRQRAVLWPTGGGIINLGLLPGGDISYATGINSQGEVCGNSGDGSVLNNLAFFRDEANGSPLVDIGNLGFGWAFANDINDFSEIVGSSRGGGPFVEPFRWRAATQTMTGLGSLRGETARASGTNNRGQVVGYDNRTGPGGGDLAFLVTPGQGMSDLNTLIASGSGWVLERANGVNNAGQIVGVGRLNGQTRGFLLTPGPTHVVPPCFADLNRDEVVNIADLTLFLGQFGASVTPGAGADVNGDGAVNISDLTTLLGGFGGACQ